MNDLTQQPNEQEKGQVLVIAVAMICALAIVMLFFLNIQRAYNLSNFLDETAELAAQAAAEPKADSLLTGNIIVDESQARIATKAAIQYSAESNLGDLDGRINQLTCQMETPLPTDCPAGSLTVLNPPNSGCEKYNASGDTECEFPVVIVQLILPYRLFGVDFTVGAQGVAVVGENTQTNTIQTPTEIPVSTIAFPEIIITVQP